MLPGVRNAPEFARPALPDTPLWVRRHALSEKWQGKGDKIVQWICRKRLVFDSNGRLNYGRSFEKSKGNGKFLSPPLPLSCEPLAPSGPPGAGGFFNALVIAVAGVARSSGTRRDRSAARLSAAMDRRGP
jgi:hypothetical protein